MTDAEAVAPSLLSLEHVSAGYGELVAVHDVSLSVSAGSVLGIIGANGAGKTTLLKAICGLMRRGDTAHMQGRIEFEGRDISNLEAADIVDAGVAYVPEGRRLFKQMTVEENLLAGAYLRRCRRHARQRLAEVFELFPRLGERRKQIVWQMSGGEQQMVAIGRALMSSPRLVLFDELSLGLAPIVIDDIYRNIEEIRTAGVACVVVEQSMARVLNIATQLVVMLEGGIVLRGRPSELSQDAIQAAYFGSAE